MERYVRSLFVVFTLVLLTGCATPYGSAGLTGGYSEEQLSENSYRVKFKGNGYTSSDKVWNYWMYRCAELTKLKGFSYYHVTVEKKQASLNDENAERLASYFSEADWWSMHEYNTLQQPHESFVKTKKGGSYTYVPSYSYGYTTVTTYSAQGVIKMYKNSQPLDADVVLDADSVIKSLDPYVKTGGEGVSPTRTEVLDRAMIVVPPTAPPGPAI